MDKKAITMPQKPHILFLANHYRGPGRAGGARTWHQVRELVKTFRVTLIIPKIDPLTQEELSSEDLPEFSGMTLKIAECRVGSRKSLWGRIVYQTSSAIGSFLKALSTKNTDAVLAMGAPPVSALSGYLVAKAKAVPILLDVRDIPLETAEELGLVSKAWLLQIARVMEGIIFRRVDRIVCVSDEMAEFVCARGVSPQRVSTNYIGYDNFEANLTASNRHRIQLIKPLDKETCFVVFYAGTLATLVDIPTVIKAAELLKSNRRIGFMIVGDGERRAWYEEYASSKGLNVCFTGRIPKERVHELCISADVCVYPLRGGPAAGAMMGNKVFDYLGAGKPIIYTGPDGAVARLIHRLEAGMVLPEKDADELARVISELAENPEKFSRMGANGKKVVLAEMTAKHSARYLSKLIAKMIEKR